MNQSQKPIGVFDSGVGGLTVVKELIRALPHEDLVYFGDTARVPYGTKSAHVVKTFAMQDARFLCQYDVKMIVVACHTVTSVALDLLKKSFPIPVLGVVEPGIKGAIETTSNRHIAVIGTKGTIHSNTYAKQIKLIDPPIRVESKACPLFVPIAEEGWLDGDIAERIASEYLIPLKKKEIDTLILGCTHYPLLKPVIQKTMGDGVRIIDSAEETAKNVLERLRNDHLLNPSDKPGKHSFYVSDIPFQFREIGERFLGCSFDNLEQVDLDSMDFSKVEKP